jgi:glyoxylase-like metal-dependent hydrolase (beta-lactamase superfamily II)
LAEATADGIAANPRQQIKTLKAIRDLAQSRQLIYLPTHDPDVERRLAQRDTSAD